MPTTNILRDACRECDLDHHTVLVMLRKFRTKLMDPTQPNRCRINGLGTFRLTRRAESLTRHGTRVYRRPADNVIKLTPPSVDTDELIDLDDFDSVSIRVRFAEPTTQKEMLVTVSDGNVVTHNESQIPNFPGVSRDPSILFNNDGSQLVYSMIVGDNWTGPLDRKSFPLRKGGGVLIPTRQINASPISDIAFPAQALTEALGVPTRFGVADFRDHAFALSMIWQKLRDYVTE